MLQVARWKM